MNWKEDRILQMRQLSKASRGNCINYCSVMQGRGAGKDACHQRWRVLGRVGGNGVTEEIILKDSNNNFEKIH